MLLYMLSSADRVEEVSILSLSTQLIMCAPLLFHILLPLLSCARIWWTKVAVSKDDVWSRSILGLLAILIRLVIQHSNLLNRFTELMLHETQRNSALTMKAVCRGFYVGNVSCPIHCASLLENTLQTQYWLQQNWGCLTSNQSHSMGNCADYFKGYWNLQ